MSAPPDKPAKVKKRPITFALYGLTPQVEKAVGRALVEDRVKDLRKLIKPLHAADLADLLERQDRERPVTDGEGRLGVVTINDVVTVSDAEAEEDRCARRRLKTICTAMSCGWCVAVRLLVNLLTAVVASMVIGAFQGRKTGLAVLMPIVASMGGNAGTQTVTVAVRALAMRELTSINALRFVLRETLVGSVNAVAFAVVAGAVSWFWFDDPMVAGIMAAAMAVNLVVAGLFGTVVPLTLDRLGVDPAVASSVFMTTVTDVIGFLSFLGLAALWLL